MKKIDNLKKIIINFGFISSGIFLSGFIGYLFHIIIARLMSPNDYSIIVSLLSIIAVVTAPSASLVLIVCKEVSYLLTKDNSQELMRFFFFKIYKIFTVILICLFFLSYFSKSYFLSQFNVSLFEYFLMVGLIFLTFVIFFHIGFIQAFETFKVYSSTFVIFNILKVCLAYILISSGHEKTGVLIALTLAAILQAYYTFYFINREISILKNLNFKKYIFVSINLKNSFTIIVANVSFIIITQSDVLMVKFFFDQQYLNIYTPVSTLSKIILYIPSAFTIIFYPIFVKSFLTNAKVKDIIFLIIIFNVIAGLSVSLFFYFFSEPLIINLIGYGYKESSTLLSVSGFGFIPFSIIFILEHYYMARNTIFFAYLLFFSIPIQMVLYFYFGSYYFSPILINLITGSCILLIFALAYKIKSIKLS